MSSEMKACHSNYWCISCTSNNYNCQYSNKQQMECAGKNNKNICIKCCKLLKRNKMLINSSVNMREICLLEKFIYWVIYYNIILYCNVGS